MPEQKRPLTREQFAQYPRAKQNQIIFDQLNVVSMELARLSQGVEEQVKSRLDAELKRVHELRDDACAVLEKIMQDPYVRALVNTATRKVT